MLPLLFFTGLLLSALAWLLGPPLWCRWRRARVQRQPFPRAWRAVLQRQFPAYRRLPAALQMELKRHVQVLLAEKAFIGCSGLVVTDAMRVLVAAQAALLLLNRGTDYFPNLRQVLLYPGDFFVERSRHDGGVVHEARQALAGESWQQGQVILSWDAVQHGAAVPDDGRNVVIHEFAHQLDQERGRANGAPWLGRRDRYPRWAAVLSGEFDALRGRIARGDDPGLIDPYAATDPAEFFAVVSEHFFEQPQALADAHPALYGELAAYYGSDPRAWG